MLCHIIVLTLIFVRSPSSCMAEHDSIDENNELVSHNQSVVSALINKCMRLFDASDAVKIKSYWHVMIKLGKLNGVGEKSNIQTGHLKAIIDDLRLNAEDIQSLEIMIDRYENVLDKLEANDSREALITLHSRRNFRIQPTILPNMKINIQKTRKATSVIRSSISDKFTYFLRTLDSKSLFDNEFLTEDWESIEDVVVQTQLLSALIGLNDKHKIFLGGQSTIDQARFICRRLKHMMNFHDSNAEDHNDWLDAGDLPCGSLGYVEMCTEYMREKFLGTTTWNIPEDYVLGIGLLCLHRQLSIGFNEGRSCDSI